MKISQQKTWAAVAIVVAVALLLWLLRASCNQAMVVAPIDSTTYWKNKYDKEVASQKGMAVQFQLKEKKLADSLADAYNTKAKWLQEWVLANTETRTELVPDKESLVKEYEPVVVNNSRDSCPPSFVKRMRQTFHSPYYDAQVQIGDSSYLKLQGRDTVTVLWKIVKEGRFLNRRNLLQIDVSTANPDTRVAGLKAFRAGPIRPKRGGIGVQMGYEFDGKRFRPYWGLGFSYNLIRF